MREFFGLDDDWVRPLPNGWFRRDATIALLTFAAAILGLEVMRSLGAPDDWPRWGLYGASALGAAPLAWRRRYPLTVMVATAAHMFVFGMLQYLVMGNLPMQGAYFFAIFTAMAWGRDRGMAAVATVGVVIFMFGWVAVQLSVASMRDSIMTTYSGGRGPRPDAWFGPVTGAVLYSYMMNTLFFFTAVGAGANSWRGARARAYAEDQARTIEAQSQELTERAIVDERLRIARELHDVVAHHVAAIGVQAAASRKLLTKEPEVAAASLSNVEASSREAVTQMRGLLGTLRVGETPHQGGEDRSQTSASASRAPEPTLADVPTLIEEVRAAGLQVMFTDLTGGVAVPTEVGHSLYRTVQEALANVRRHSTATKATVTLRAARDGAGAYIEAEVLDEGRARQGTSGSGLGLLGMRERITAHRGSAEIGPRVTGGYRVRVRLPLSDAENAKGA